jgi:hypothetical protein
MNKNFEFIILSPNYNIGGLRITLNSIECYYPDSNVICVVNKDVKSDQLQEMKKHCNCIRSGKTITSLINKGYSKIKSNWGVLVLEGARVSRCLNRYKNWMASNDDIFFPLMVEFKGDKKILHDTLYNCSLNGICIHKEMFDKVGNFSENPLEISRRFWTLQAYDEGAIFKSVLGIRIC